MEPDARMDGRSADCEAADEALFLVWKSVHRKWSELTLQES